MTEYSDNALTIYKRLYFDEQANETIPEQVHKRVAQTIGDSISQSIKFEDMLNQKAFRPNTPCLLNAGRKSNKEKDNQYCACFIIGLKDSMESIIEMWGICAKIYASGAGVGIPLTNLREKGCPISSGGFASGPLSYIQVIDLISDTVRSGGKCLASYQPLFTNLGIKTVKELSDLNKEFIIISHDNNAGRMFAKKARAFHNGFKPIWILKTDKGEFHLSPDHPFKLADGSIKQLKELKSGMRLMACTTYIRPDGYLRVNLKDGKKGKRQFHRMIMEDAYQINIDDKVIHHCNKDKLDNKFSNLKLLTNKKHNFIHGKNYSIFNYKKFPKCGFKNGMHHQNSFWKNPLKVFLYKRKQSKILLQNPERGSYMRLNARKSRMLNTGYRLINSGFNIESFEKYVKAYTTLHGDIGVSKSKKLESFKNNFGSYDNYYQELASNNHIVKEIIPFKKLSSVYAIEVDCSSPNDYTENDNHNFMIWDINNPNLSGSGVIVYNTRRAANMGVFKHDHPDAMEIIKAKNLNNNILSSFNLSMSVTDFFMELATDDPEQLDYKQKYKSPYSKSPMNNESLNTKELWKLIIDKAWECGDPGLMFIDTVNKFNPFPKTYPIDCSNPCVSGDTLIQTVRGEIPIKNLTDYLTIEVYTKDKFGELVVKPARFFKTRTKAKMITVNTNKGSLKVTSDHQFITPIGKVKANDLKSEQELIGLLRKKKIENLISCKVISIDRTPEYGSVFDGNVMDTHCYFANGILISNCGEVMLPPWSVCNIGSINLNKCILNNTTTNELYFNYNTFKELIKASTQFLNNVIDKTSYIDPKFEEMCKTTRPIGLGIMGFADILIKLKVKYGSQEAIELFEQICFLLTNEAIRESINICKEGANSIEIPKKDSKHFESLIKYYTSNNEDIINDYNKYGIRNSTWTSLAPTGSISISADCSYSWEPLMALIWEKTLVDSNQILEIIDLEFKKVLPIIAEESNYSIDEIIQDIINNQGSIQHIDYISQKYKDIFVVAHDIDPFDKIKMQARGQKYISLAISSTCNLPNSATKEDVEAIYNFAWEENLKGITIYRDGCKENQIINFGKQKEVIKEQKEITIIERPVKRSGETIEIPTPHGKLFVTCNYHDSKPFEIFFRVGKQGALPNVLLDALGRVCSKALQNGLPLAIISDTLIGLQGEKFWFKIDDIVKKSNGAESIVDAIAQIMDYHWINNKQDNIIIDNPIDEECIQETDEKESLGITNNLFETCPQCSRKTLRHDTGCRGGECTFCGFTNCG